MSDKNKFYAVLHNTATGEARATQNTPKGRSVLKQFADENCKAYRVKANSVENAVEVFAKEQGVECTFVKIVYPKNTPTVKEFEL